MNIKITVFIILSLILVIPSVSAQEISIGEKANQKSVEVIIDETGNIHVKHEIRSSNSPVQMKLIDGIVENLTITDDKGKDQMLTVIGDNDGIMIFPSNSNSIVEYDLKDTLLLKDNVWTLDFLYLETTTFIVPEKADLIFVNDRPVYLDGKKGFSCHGCQMTLEYSLDEPKNSMKVNLEDREFIVEIKTFADIENFNFDQPAKTISFKVNDDNRFVTAVIPLELLWGPYAVFLDNEKIFFHEYINNGTHVWINIKPDTAGEIAITGTIVVDPIDNLPQSDSIYMIVGGIIASIVIGFLIIFVIRLIRKSNLH